MREGRVNTIKLWIDDMRQPPDMSWLWCRTVNETKSAIRTYERNMWDDTIIIDLNHDTVDFSAFGGDHIEILNWLEREGIVDTGYFFHIHSMNPVEIENMRTIIQHNGWREI